MKIYYCTFDVAIFDFSRFDVNCASTLEQIMSQIAKSDTGPIFSQIKKRIESL